MVQRIQEFCIANIVVGKCGVEVKTITSPKMVVKHRVTKMPNPYLGRVTKVTIYNNVMMGVEFKPIVESRAKMSGATPITEYEVEGNKCGPWVDEKNKFCRSKGEGRNYLQFIFRRNTHPKPKWFVDGREATDREVFEISEYLSTSKSSHNKQHAYGVIEGYEVEMRTPMVESVAYIKWGDKMLVLK